MAGFKQTPRILLRLIHLPPRLAYTLGLGPLIGKVILLLTTRGRKSGRPRVTPLQYEEIDGCYYLAAALGGRAQIIRDPGRIADFLALRLKRHPRMVAAILRSAGLSIPPSRADLEQYAVRLTLVVVQPDE